MEFSLVICYALLNLVIFIWLLKRHSLLSPGIIVSAFYLIVAIFAVPAYHMLPNDDFFCLYDFSDIRLWPYVLYFILTYIFIIPIFKYEECIQYSTLSLPRKKTKIFVVFFVICSLASIFIYARMIINYSIFENIDEIRQNHYAGIQITAYNNQIEHFALLFAYYFPLPAMIIFFYLLTNAPDKPITSKWSIALLGISIFFPAIMEASRTASRSVLISLFFELLLCYSLFRHRIAKKSKIIIFLALLLSVTLILSYSFIVTDARFGRNNEEDSISSLICYWGQPTLIFNSQVSQIDDYAWGARFFYPVFELFEAQPDWTLSKISQGWGVCFSTLIGDIWQDIGFFTIFLVPLIALIFNNWIKSKESVGLSEFYAMIYYASTIQKGALVTGYGMCINISITIFMYFFLKYYFFSKTES